MRTGYSEPQILEAAKENEDIVSKEIQRDWTYEQPTNLIKYHINRAQPSMRRQGHKQNPKCLWDGEARAAIKELRVASREHRRTKQVAEASDEVETMWTK